MKSAIITYIYPKAVQFIELFIKSINNISTSKIQLIIFNDGVSDSDTLFSNLNIPYHIISAQGSINEIRHWSFQYLFENFPLTENFIFQDIDDLFSNNRFDVLIEKLSKYNIVCNDLATLHGQHLNQSLLWGQRLENNFEFDHHFIENKNILGLGNVAVKRNVLNIKTSLSNIPPAYDWFYFYQILKLGRVKAIFTSECQTYYLQHEENIAGICKKLTYERIQHIITVKKKHYESLIQLNFLELENYLEKLNNIKDINPIKTSQHHNFFWWEETEML